MKKYIFVISAAVCLIAFCGCGHNSEDVAYTYVSDVQTHVGHTADTHLEQEPDDIVMPQIEEDISQQPAVYDDVQIAGGTPETQSIDIEDAQPACTLSVNCADAVGKAGDKEDIIPPGGVVLAEQRVSFSDGESVFDVLVRTMRENKIHIEYEYTPIYGSSYIEGIANLYEFDCGSGSGWVYMVNGKSTDLGCSDYILKDGDRVEWMYTTAKNAVRGNIDE